MAGRWYKEDELSIRVKFDKDSLSGLIAKARAQMEDLNNTIVELSHALEFEAVEKSESND